MDESMTPRTDKLVGKQLQDRPEWIDADFARQLERELAACHTNTELVHAECRELVAAIDRRIAKLEARIARLTRALLAIEQRANESGIDPMAERETVYAMHALARAALSEQPDDGKVLVPVDQLRQWLEYWNGSANLRAMQDALDHITAEIGKVLAAARVLVPRERVWLDSTRDGVWLHVEVPNAPTLAINLDVYDEHGPFSGKPIADAYRAMLAAREGKP